MDGIQPLIVAAIGCGLALLAAITLWFSQRRRIVRRLIDGGNAKAVSPIGIEDIWETWRAGTLVPAAAFVGEQPPAVTLDAAALAGVRRDLIETEARIWRDARPLEALRREIMAGVDRRMINQEILALPEAARASLRGRSADVIASDAEAQRYLAANDLRTRLLRYYGAAKFADRADNDWYQLYEQAARLKSRGLRNFLTQQLSANGSDGRYQAMTLVGEQLKQRLLAVPPGTSFPRRNAESMQEPLAKENQHE